jgi:hypothetical protein
MLAAPYDPGGNPALAGAGLILTAARAKALKAVGWLADDRGDIDRAVQPRSALAVLPSLFSGRP